VVVNSFRVIPGGWRKLLGDDRAFIQRMETKWAVTPAIFTRFHEPGGKPGVRESWAEARMDVDDFVFITPHEVGERIFMNRASTTNRCRAFPIVPGPAPRLLPARPNSHGHTAAMLLCPRGEIGVVTHHQGRFGRQFGCQQGVKQWFPSSP